MVRLRVRKTVDDRRTGVFQFLHGAIKGLNDKPTTGMPLHFNSYMVRLRDLIFFCSMVVQYDFNSYMVRLRVSFAFSGPSLQTRFQFLHGAIKGPDYSKQQAYQLNFNSYMVRLRDFISIEFLLKEIFQFLHGAIKGNKLSYKLLGMKAISIPTWCD